MDIHSELAEAVMAIKSDSNLKSAFLKILEIGSYSQQVRVDKINEAISPLNPPEPVTRLLTLLRDDKIANLVFVELAKD